MSALSTINKHEIRDLLGKGWLTHDGMWFYHACREVGVEKANQLNKAAIRSVAAIEVERAGKILGITRDGMGSFEDIYDFIHKALEITLPHSVFKRFEFRASPEQVIHWEWEKGQCFAYKGIKQMGVIEDYKCGVIYRIECWLDALDVSYCISPETDTCRMHHHGTCSGNIRILVEA